MKNIDISKLHSQNYYENIVIGDKNIDGRLVMPSGIRCTNAPTIANIFATVPEIGIITTKSVSVSPKEGYKEPIFARYAEDFYINAVGLANPGAEIFAKELQKIVIPTDKFLLVSIFGGNAGEFADAACILEDVADGFELNVSCPHAGGYGIEIGQDRDLVVGITETIASLIKKPVIVKLSATCSEIEKTAKAVINAGAAGITAINSVGPSIIYLDNKPILSNRAGGLSGSGIMPVGMNTVRRIRDAIGEDPIIIGMGGILERSHIEQYFLSGADFFGIGSALTGMNSTHMEKYFHYLQSDILNNKNRAGAFRKSNIKINMDYHKATLKNKIRISREHFKLELEDEDGILGDSDCAGKFYFLAIPGQGEKPFALFSRKDNSFIIRQVGHFTKYLSERSSGDTIYYRGPYGKSLPVFKNKTIYLIGGGTGTIALLEIAKKLESDNKIRFIFGYRNIEEIFEIELFKEIGKVEIIAEDGLTENKGVVTDLLARGRFEKYNPDQLVFINSGPEMMVTTCFEKESAFTKKENIWGSITYITSCGVGICGKCSTDKGLLSCIDGPFISG